MKHLVLESSYYRELQKEYALHLERLGYDEKTTRSLPSQVREFFYYLERNNIYDIKKVSPKDIKEYYRYLKERPNSKRAGTLSESMITTHTWAIRILMSWLQAEGRIETNPMSMLRFPKPRHKEREVLTRKEIQSLYEGCGDYFDRCVISLFYGCGLRKSEGQDLNVKDIDFSNKLLYVRSGKGKRRRVVPMAEKVTSDLKAYYYYERSQRLRKNKSTQKEKQQAFLLNIRGERIKGSVLWRALHRIVRDAGIKDPHRITLHSLRHSIATHLLESGLGVEQVRDFLGHSYLETTQIYTRVNSENIKNNDK